jgi:hypothetical protein
MDEIEQRYAEEGLDMKTLKDRWAGGVTFFAPAHRCVTLALASLLLLSQYVSADSFGGRTSLRGIRGFVVAVSHVHDDTRGLTDEMLQTEVELRLRTAGIKVLGQDPGAPILHLEFAWDKPAEGPLPFPFSANLSVWQTAQLTRDVSIPAIMAITWQQGCFGIENGGTKELRRHVGSLMDMLLDDYSAENRPPTGVAEAKAPGDEPPGSFSLQVAAYKNQPAAESVVARLKKQGLPTYLVAPSGKAGLYFVRVGPFQDRAGAENVRGQVASAGFTAFIIKN